MRSIINDKANEARERSEMYRRSMGAPQGAGANPLGLGAGGSNVGFGQKRTDLTQHTEQYRHNTGWVAASIKPIASRIARQAVRLARVTKSTGSKVSGPSGTKSASGTLSSKPWEAQSGERSPAAIWFKKHLPGAMKQLAAQAELIESHPVLDAIDDPNPIMVRWSLFFVTVASLLLTGKGYWWVKAKETEDGEGKAAGIEIWPLPSSWVSPVHTEEKLYQSWEVTPDGTHEAFPVPAEQIIFFSLPDPSSLLGSQSVLQNQARAVISDEAIAEAQRRGFANGVFPGVAVVIGRQTGIDGKPGDRPTLNREQRAQIITAFKQAYRGVYNYDEPIILDQLIQDVRRVTSTNREMDFQNSGQYTKERITQGFGVNPISMGQVEGANRASSATADDHLCQNTVNPIIELMSQTITAWLNPILAAPGERLCLFIEEAHAVDPDSDRADWGALWAAGACSKDELRAGLRSLPPMVGGSVAYVDSKFAVVDARLATEASAPLPPRSLVPGSPHADEPPAAPAAPAPQAEPTSATQTSEPTGEPVPDAGAAALNGAQIASLLEVLDKLAAGQYPAEAVEAILSASFPTLEIEVIRRLIAAIQSGAKPPQDGTAPAKRYTRSPEFVLAVIAALKRNPADTASECEIEIEDIRQSYPFDCGAAIAYVAARALGCEPGTYAEMMVALDTEEEVGTDPEDIKAYFAHRGCDVRARPGRTSEYLRNELRAGRLCLCPVQYFGDGPQPGAEGGPNESGHWVLVYGFTRDALKVFDPIDGRLEVAPNDFVLNWFDRAQDGRPFVRYCVSAGPKPKSIIDPETNTGRAN